MGSRSWILYVEGYTVAAPGEAPVPSDAIGYGISASGSILHGLRRAGLDVRTAVDPGRARDRDVARDRLDWILSCYRGVLRSLRDDPPALIFVFHAFSAFPTEIRRMLFDLREPVPIVGYTHGSHWDPTDSYRFEVYPGLEILDLANLLALDRVLVVSRYMQATLRQNIGRFDQQLGQAVDDKVRVVGLPLDVGLIDACRDVRSPGSRPTVVFNHAPVSSKHPDVFARVIGRVLAGYDVGVVFTRRFPEGAAGHDAVQRLATRFPERVVLGQDLSRDAYYRTLWRSDLQVSTATHESLGMSTLEAMYTENCCLLPRIGSYPEITDDDPDALYEPGDEVQLERRLRHFLDHPAERQEVAARMRRLASRYDPGTVVGAIADVLRQTCPGLSPADPRSAPGRAVVAGATASAADHSPPRATS